MQKWEYVVLETDARIKVVKVSPPLVIPNESRTKKFLAGVEITTEYNPGLAFALNFLGKSGWELTGIQSLSTPNSGYYILKRPLPD